MGPAGSNPLKPIFYHLNERFHFCGSWIWSGSDTAVRVTEISERWALHWDKLLLSFCTTSLPVEVFVKASLFYKEKSTQQQNQSSNIFCMFQKCGVSLSAANQKSSKWKSDLTFKVMDRLCKIPGNKRSWAGKLLEDLRIVFPIHMMGKLHLPPSLECSALQGLSGALHGKSYTFLH